MRLEAVELRRLRLPLKSAWRASHGTESHKDVLLVRVAGPDTEGWGECAALAAPTYTPEYVEGAEHVLQHHLVPRLLASGQVAADEVGDVLAPIRGHRMAKAAVEAAVLDAECRAAGISLARRLGGVRDVVEAGVAVGIFDTLAKLVEVVEGFVDQGYRRVKLKIQPGWDIEPVAAVRAAVGPAIALLVDANGAYTLDGSSTLCHLDDFDLVVVEQPLAPDDLRGHAQLARRLRTPVGLDESIETRADAEVALDLGACSVVNLKPGRCGGCLEAARIHDVCAGRGVPLWCGGMLETGVGRAAAVALASLPGFTLTGDLSASDRYFDDDVTEPFALEDGCLRVPAGPGLGVEPRPEVLEAFTTSSQVIR